VSAPSTIQLAGLHADCLTLRASGQEVPAHELRVVINAVMADKSHAYFDRKNPSFEDATNLISDLRHFILEAEGALPEDEQ